jgi:hypothetical protein
MGAQLITLSPPALNAAALAALLAEAPADARAAIGLADNTATLNVLNLSANGNLEAAGEINSAGALNAYNANISGTVSCGQLSASTVDATSVNATSINVSNSVNAYGVYATDVYGSGVNAYGVYAYEINAINNLTATNTDYFGAYTFPTLPTPSSTYARAIISDYSGTLSWGSAAAGGGISVVPVWWDGSAWYVG